jgi:hypothetical protein
VSDAAAAIDDRGSSPCQFTNPCPITIHTLELKADVESEKAIPDTWAQRDAATRSSPTRQRPRDDSMAAGRLPTQAKLRPIDQGGNGDGDGDRI